MTIAQHIAVIESLCSRDFPGEYGGPGAGGGGAGFHLVELACDDAPAAYGECGACADEDAAEQCEAWRDGLSERLTARWGEPRWIGLDGVLLRSFDPGEHIPEPWASFSAYVGNARLWRVGGTGRRLALGVTRPGEERAPRLVALVTETDPP
ncbi:hypothetical protein [Streptomyces minutiscleroticus]|uniref:Uncharacterized protein n=1 Tax=Streptomyces minutiscleroticus TaxID=68238 RepID=A0A918NLA6_9ACTN|nr:hypothetical protein [Streptomyces minutiscleroticus]GGX78305.1 hypothetical protein GCM10010358_35860 [Streptomyces minutiscleroticus]